jgi:hypothetical protein
VVSKKAEVIELLRLNNITAWAFRERQRDDRFKIPIKDYQTASNVTASPHSNVKVQEKKKVFAFA